MSVIQNSFDTMSQIEKHEAAELLFLKKAKEQRKAANLLRKQITVKQEANLIEISESNNEDLPRDFMALPQSLSMSSTIDLVTPQVTEIVTPPPVTDLVVPSAPVKKKLSPEHLQKLKEGREKKRLQKLEEKEKQVEVKRTLDFLAELDEIIGGSSEQSAVAEQPVVAEQPAVATQSKPSKTLSLKGTSEERAAIIASLPEERLTKGKPISWRKDTKHHPLSKIPTSILSHLEKGASTEDDICSMCPVTEKSLKDYIRELKKQNLIE